MLSRRMHNVHCIACLGACVSGGVSIGVCPGGCMCPGGSNQVGVSVYRRVCVQVFRRISAQRCVCLSGGMCPGTCGSWGSDSVHLTPPCRQNSSHTLVKTLPSATTIADGKYEIFCLTSAMLCQICVGNKIVLHYFKDICRFQKKLFEKTIDGQFVNKDAHHACSIT